MRNTMYLADWQLQDLQPNGCMVPSD